MPNKEMNMVLKILGIIGAIFCLIAIFVPWGGGVYLWGEDLGYTWSIFHIEFFTNSMYHSIFGAAQCIFFGIAMIIIFILTIISTILAFLGVKAFQTKGTNKFLTPAILSTVSFILYIIAVSTLARGWSGGLYGIGFVMILIAMIMFYITFILGKALGVTPSPVGYQQTTQYQQPTQQPMMMYQQNTQHSPPSNTGTQPQPADQQTTPSQEQAKPAASPKFCPSCGAKLVANSKFCPYCGNKI